MSRKSTSICIGCGLCCDGTLHANTRVKEGGIAAVEAVGLKIVADGPALCFEQPCARFSCGTCSVYDARPPVCRTYRCALLRGVEAGNIAEGDARAKIGAARDLVARVLSVDPGAITPAKRSLLAMHLKQSLGELTGQARIAAAEALLHLNALEFLLEGWFRYRKPETDEAASARTSRADLPMAS